MNEELLRMMSGVRQFSSSGSLLQSTRGIRFGLGAIEQLFKDDLSYKDEIHNGRIHAVPVIKLNRTFVSDQHINALPTKLQALAFDLRQLGEVKYTYSLCQILVSDIEEANTGPRGNHGIQRRNVVSRSP